MLQQAKARNIDEEKQKRDEERLFRRMQEINYKILVLSGKGGVGKSTVAVNLAAALSAMEKKAGLLDVDIHGPSVPTLLGLQGCRFEFEGNEILPVTVSDTLKVVSIGFLLDKKTDAVIWRGPRKFHMIKQFLTDVNWGSLDYLVVDSPPGTGDEPMAVAQLAGAPSGAVIVTTPQDVAIHDVRRCVTFCHTLSIPVLGIVENMSGLVCPHCGETIDLFKSGGGEALAEEMNVPFLGKIPIEPEIVRLGDDGLSYSEHNTNHPAVNHFKPIAQQIISTSMNTAIES